MVAWKSVSLLRPNTTSTHRAMEKEEQNVARGINVIRVTRLRFASRKDFCFTLGTLLKPKELETLTCDELAPHLRGFLSCHACTVPWTLQAE